MDLSECSVPDTAGTASDSTAIRARRVADCPERVRRARSIQYWWWVNTIAALAGVGSFAIAFLEFDFSREHALGAMPARPPFELRLTSEPPFDTQVVIEGSTPYADCLHYLVVRDSHNRAWIQDGPIPVSPTGLLGATATLGSAAVGGGETYYLQLFATRTRPSAGEPVPHDALLSNTIEVRRREPSDE